MSGQKAVLFSRSPHCYFVISFLKVHMVNTMYLFSFVEATGKFVVAELSILKLGSSSVLVILAVLLALMRIRAYVSKALQWWVYVVFPRI